MCYGGQYKKVETLSKECYMREQSSIQFRLEPIRECPFAQTFRYFYKIMLVISTI